MRCKDRIRIADMQEKIKNRPAADGARLGGLTPSQEWREYT